MTKQPLLTIAIPTWNRSLFLEKTLNQLYRELEACEPNSVEVLVSDNFSTDSTSAVIEQVINKGLKLRYIRNNENIGSDSNIAQCFNLATGKYVLILGDDDLLVDKALPPLFEQLKSEKFGVVCMRPYGFDKDFRLEHPGAGGSVKVFHDAGLYLAAIGPLMTLISSCVIHKSILQDLDATEFCGENLVQVHLVICAALAAEQNLFMNRYLIACQRNNSGGYDFSKVFVESLGSILDGYQSMGLTKKAIALINARLIMSYFPLYLLKLRLEGAGDIDTIYQRFYKRYKGQWYFYFWNYPILKLPRALAIVWGVVATLIGRVLNGDFKRGLSFFINKIILRV